MPEISHLKGEYRGRHLIRTILAGIRERPKKQIQHQPSRRGGEGHELFREKKAVTYTSVFGYERYCALKGEKRERARCEKAPCNSPGATGVGREGGGIKEKHLGREG